MSKSWGPTVQHGTRTLSPSGETIDLVVTVRSLAGELLAQLSSVPNNVGDLKATLEKITGIPQARQQLVNDTQILRAREQLHSGSTPLELVLITTQDETPMYSWDVKAALRTCGSEDVRIDFEDNNSNTIKARRLRFDYINVLTQEPIRSEAHYFQFIMHQIGDEQWCGVAADRNQAGPRLSGRELNAWTYYCGRQGSSRNSLVDGKAAFHAERRALKEFAKPRANKSDVIGMLVDMNKSALAFDLNGKFQGACAIPNQPLYVITHLDEPGDCVELRKLFSEDAPEESQKALTDDLLDMTSGQHLSYW